VTKRQKQCLDFILSFWKRHGYGPSYQEISDGLDMKNKSGAFRIVELLCARGKLTKHAGQARSVCGPAEDGQRQ
jgi:SOS-response transcriptional repressor LexA